MKERKRKRGEQKEGLVHKMGMSVVGEMDVRG